MGWSFLRATLKALHQRRGFTSMTNERYVDAMQISNTKGADCEL